MSKLPPSAVLLATLSASIGVIVTDAPVAIFGLGAPALLGVLASERGRRSFGRRLLPTAPLVAVAIALRWFGHAQRE
jgi:energy-coupling factor transporter transmembrane protein EcfT